MAGAVKDSRISMLLGPASFAFLLACRQSSGLDPPPPVGEGCGTRQHRNSPWKRLLIELQQFSRRDQFAGFQCRWVLPCRCLDTMGFSAVRGQAGNLLFHHLATSWFKEEANDEMLRAVAMRCPFREHMVLVAKDEAEGVMPRQLTRKRLTAVPMTYFNKP